MYANIRYGHEQYEDPTRARVCVCVYMPLCNYRWLCKNLRREEEPIGSHIFKHELNPLCLRACACVCLCVCVYSCFDVLETAEQKRMTSDCRSVRV